MLLVRKLREVVAMRGGEARAPCDEYHPVYPIAYRALRASLAGEPRRNGPATPRSWPGTAAPGRTGTAATIPAPPETPARHRRCRRKAPPPVLPTGSIVRGSPPRGR